MKINKKYIKNSLLNMIKLVIYIKTTLPNYTFVQI